MAGCFSFTCEAQTNVNVQKHALHLIAIHLSARGQNIASGSWQLYRLRARLQESLWVSSMQNPPHFECKANTCSLGVCTFKSHDVM